MFEFLLSKECFLQEWTIFVTANLWRTVWLDSSLKKLILNEFPGWISHPDSPDYVFAGFWCPISTSSWIYRCISQDDVSSSPRNSIHKRLEHCLGIFEGLRWDSTIEISNSSSTPLVLASITKLNKDHEKHEPVVKYI